MSGSTNAVRSNSSATSVSAEGQSNGSHNWHGKSTTIRLNLDEIQGFQDLIGGLPVNADMLSRLSTKLRNCKFSILRRTK